MFFQSPKSSIPEMPLYIQEVQSIIEKIPEATLSQVDKKFIHQIKNVPSNTVGIFYLYCLLNDYLIEINKTSDSVIKEEFPDIFNKLHELYQSMVKDPRLNWFGTQNADELNQLRGFYSEVYQYPQRMQYFLVNMAQHVKQAKEKIIKSEDVSYLDKDFLHAYLNAELDSTEIEKLNHLSNLFKENEIDFFTIQIAAHLQRYIIANANKFPTPKWKDFIQPRAGHMYTSIQFPERNARDLIERIEKYIPESELKDKYREYIKKCEESGKKPFFYILMGIEPELLKDRKFSTLRTPNEDIATPLKAPHYKKYMTTILEKIGEQSLWFDCKDKIPIYGQENKLVEAFFSATMYAGRLLDSISNKRVDSMIDQSSSWEHWPGESIFKHCEKLYVISVSTPDPEVREEARRHLEAIYSCYMPYYRGSAAISEGLAKLPLLANEITPTKMIGNILPDLGANCQYGPKGFVTHYNEFYPEHNQTPFIFEKSSQVDKTYSQQPKSK